MSAFFNSIFGKSHDGETKSSANLAAETLGNPNILPTLTSSSTTSSTTPPTSFAQFRQISLPGEWTHDNSDVDSDIGSGKFKFGFESLRNASELSTEFLKLAQAPIGPKATFLSAARALQSTPQLWTTPVQEAYEQVLAAYTQAASTPFAHLMHAGQHIYGVALYASTSKEAQHKTTGIAFQQGDLLRLERKDNDTWHVRVQGTAPLGGQPFAGATSGKTGMFFTFIGSRISIVNMPVH